MNPELNAPTPERRRRSAFIVGPAVATEHGPARAGIRVYRAVSPLARLLKTGAIQPRQAQAGERLRLDWELGIAGAREAANGSASITGWYYADARLEALRRYEDACTALGPTKFVVIHVAVYERPITRIAGAKNRQEVAGILKLGLAALADHYGIDGRCSQR